MKFKIKPLVYVLATLLPACVVADNTFTTLNVCFTSPGPSSINPVPTTSITYSSRKATASCVSTITPTKTRTPDPITTTITSTSVDVATVTAPQETDTVTSIVVTNVTSTLTQTPSTHVETQTTTLNITIQLRDFSPVRSTLPEASLVGNTISKKLKRYDVEGMLVPRQDDGSDDDPDDSGDSLPEPNAAAAIVDFPQNVTCITDINVYYVKRKKVTAKPVTTYAPTPTSSFFTTITTTTTQTVIPGEANFTTDVTVTNIQTVFYTPPVVSSTTTSTLTVTSTKVGASALCSPVNFADTVSGLGITGLSDPENPKTPQFLYTGDYNATSCCYSCSINPECNAFAYTEVFPPGRKCQIVQQPVGTSDTCSEGQYSFMAELKGDPGSGYTVGNGNCAFITSSELAPPS